MRMIAMLVLGLGLSVGSAFAVTVTLSDGRTVQGDVVNADSKSVQLNVSGTNMTYYSDEIKDVDGKSLTDYVAASTIPAADLNTSAPQEPAAPIDPAKKELILKFIDVFGTRQALENNFNLMLKQIDKAKPEEAKKIRERVKVDEIIDRLLPIYDRNFTADDLNAFITFYGSPEGQKLISTIPVLMKESVRESIKYMQEKFPEEKQPK